jgi:hypothetical protein
MMSHAAIVTTLRDAGAVIRSFVAYHRTIGFDHFFLFFDDPHDPALIWARAQSDVTAIAHDENLRRTWTSLKSYVQEGDYVSREVMSRQVLNAEHAINLALGKGLRWLLHIDADELFYAPGGTTVEHFASLETKRIDTVTYLNYEAVPEREEIADFFCEVSVFKRPVRPGAAARELIKATPQLMPNFFTTTGMASRRFASTPRACCQQVFTALSGRAAMRRLR